MRKFEIEDVIAAVCSYFEVPIYLLKRHTSVMNREIGGLFEGLTYSGVSKANQRFTVRMAGDRSLRKAVERIIASMSSVKV